MAKSVNVSIRDRSDSSKSLDTEIQVVSLSVVQRLLSGAITLVTCWIVAAVCILIPVLHFVLVPLAIIVGVVAFFVRFNLKEMREASRTKCPVCSNELHLEKSAFNWPMIETCKSCGSRLTISKTN